MLFAPTALLALLAGSAVAGPVSLFKRDKRIVGYRRVSKAQAEDYKDNRGILNYDERRASGGKQLGPGVYTTPNRGGWNIGNEGDKWCVVSGDSEALDNTGSVWIPSFYQDFSDLWYQSEATYESYIKAVDDGLDAKKSFRLGRVYKDEDSLQLLIPPGLLDQEDGGLGLVVECFDTIEELPDVVVDYEQFEASGDKDPEM